MALIVPLQIFRGTKANLPALAEGQFGLATDTNELFLGNTGNVRILTAIATATVTIAVGDWAAKSATKNVAGMTATALVGVAPAPADFLAYAEAEIRATDQAAGTVTFACETEPTGDLDVNIAFSEPA